MKFKLLKSKFHLVPLYKGELKGVYKAERHEKTSINKKNRRVEEMKRNVLLLFLAVSLNLWGTIGFVVNSGSETLSKINFETGEVNNAFCALGLMPNRVALTEDFAYVVNSGDNSLQKINIETGSTASNIFIEASSNPYDIIIEGNYAFVSGALTNKVYKVNLDTEIVENSIEVGGNPAGMAILNNMLYVGNSDYATGYTNCSVSVINLGSFTVEATVPTEINPQFVAAINGGIHVSCGGNWSTIFGKICILDPGTNTITDILDIGGITSNFAITPENIVYVADGNSTALYAYNAVNLEVIYSSTNPFTPGGTMVAANDEFLTVLGGVWGQNFTVKTYDFEENLLNEYTVGLYATDLKLLDGGTSINEEQVIHTDYNLSNYPNPFNPTTTISFSVSQTPSFVNLEIFNVKGQKVKTLVNEKLVTGIHQVVWNGDDESNKSVSSGIYFYKLKSGKYTSIKKMILLK
jgi:hypothetical protein